MSGNKAKVPKIPCHTKPVTPVSNRGRFLSLKYSYSNFDFLEISLTDEMLYCNKIHNISLPSPTRYLTLLLDEEFSLTSVYIRVLFVKIDPRHMNIQ